MYDLICLGSGPAGEKAATQAAYFGHRVAVVEAQPRPGGAMVNTGTIPSKTLRETALLLSSFRRCPVPGMTDPRIDHGLSVPRFMARRLLVESEEHDRIEASFDRHGIEIIAGRGRIRDAHTVVVETPDGSTQVITGAHILVATGSSPVRPEHVPFDHPGVVDADGVLELDRLPRRMVIVGGGVIGSEYASIFAEIDVQTTLIHPREAILAFLDAECRAHLEHAMRDRGIDIRLNTTVERVETAGELVRVHCGDGSVIETDALLWAAGRSPNTRDLGLEGVGVALDDRRQIQVDASYRTAVPSIYAAGDVIGFPALAATSMEQGRVAACHMFDIGFKRDVAATQPMGIYTIPGVSSVGLTEAEAVKAGHATVIGRAVMRQNARARMLGDDCGILKCVFDRDSRKLLGATMVGEDATELIHIAQWAIVHGDGIDAFIENCFNYPSLAELFKYAAYSALRAIHDAGGEAFPFSSMAA